jgi:hypothetical protein
VNVMDFAFHSAQSSVTEKAKLLTTSTLALK